MVNKRRQGERCSKGRVKNRLFEIPSREKPQHVSRFHERAGTALGAGNMWGRGEARRGEAIWVESRRGKMGEGGNHVTLSRIVHFYHLSTRRMSVRECKYVNDCVSN